MKENKQNLQHSSQKCVICYRRYQNSRINKCSHKFCFPCINRWSKKNSSCPLCRETFSSIITKQKFKKNSKLYRQGRIKKTFSDQNQAVQTNFISHFWIKKFIVRLWYWPIQFQTVSFFPYIYNLN